MKNQLKKQYLQPEVELIRIDREISLALESAPPEGPNEGFNNTPEFFNQDAPLKA